LLNKILLIILFIKTLYMRHNNCLTRKLPGMHIFPHKRINYGHVTRYASCTQPYLVYVHVAKTAPKAVRVVRQTQLKCVCV